MARLDLPALYPILDAGVLLRAGLSIEDFARQLHAAGIRFLQYRDKDAADELFLERAAMLRGIFLPSDSCLIVNDRVPLVLPAAFDGVHIGQEDLSPAKARGLLGSQMIVGVSTHCESQLLAATGSPVDYVAIGPVFATSSKSVPDPVVGLEGVRAARAITAKLLVAIGGITHANGASVIEAGADSVAVISDLVQNPAQKVAEFSARLGNPGLAAGKSFAGHGYRKTV
jgi:thiamine-phosphate pyrophosphorylase